MAKSKGMGIKRKVFLGCIVLGMILFLSSLSSVYEFSKMNDYVSEEIAENIASIDSARKLLEVAESQNAALMSAIDGDYKSLDSLDNNAFSAALSRAGETFLTQDEKSAADSVMYAFSAYMQVAGEAQDVWMYDTYFRRDWFFNRLQPVYLKFRDYIIKLTEVCEDSLITNSQSLQDAFHRSIMPPMISLILGLLLVLLFNYYLNYYVINPVLKVTKGIKGYRQFGKKYDVRIDSNDEIAELNENVRDVIDLNQSYRNQFESQEK